MQQDLTPEEVMRWLDIERGRGRVQGFFVGALLVFLLVVLL